MIVNFDLENVLKNGLTDIMSVKKDRRAALAALYLQDFHTLQAMQQQIESALFLYRDVLSQYEAVAGLNDADIQEQGEK